MIRKYLVKVMVVIDIWFIFSYIDVIIHQLDGEQAFWNFFTLFM